MEASFSGRKTQSNILYSCIEFYILIWISLTVLFKSCIFMVNLNLNKTILQSISYIFLYYIDTDKIPGFLQ